MSLLLTGCRIGNKNIVVSNILNDRQVFKIEGTVCSLKEARVYLTNYQNIYGTAYGVDLWKHCLLYTSLAWYLSDEGEREKVMQLFDAAFGAHKDDAISKAVTKALYGNTLENSVTRLEQFAACAFAHYLSYGPVSYTHLVSEMRTRYSVRCTTQ